MNIREEVRNVLNIEDSEIEKDFEQHRENALLESEKTSIDFTKIEFSEKYLNSLSKKKLAHIYGLLTEYLKMSKMEGTLDQYFVEGTPLSIDNYPKYKEFIELGNKYKVRLITAGNRCGKTTLALLETVYHCLGRYPSWWKGKRFDKDQQFFNCWIVSDSWDTSAQIVQSMLFFEKEGADFGTGMIPGNRILKTSKIAAIANCWAVVEVRRDNGGVAVIKFKSSKAGRKMFQGTTVDLIVMDEEPPMDVYQECMMRLMTSGGYMILAFTPLQGMTEMIKSFEDGNKDTSLRRVYVRVSWYDCPHITEEKIAEMEAQIPQYLLQARKYGIPVLGSGRIYPFSREQIEIEGFNIPDFWLSWYALDVGFGTSACIIFAQNPSNDEIFAIDELYVSEMSAVEFGENVREKTLGLKGCVDPGANSRSQRDGQTVRHDLSVECGLELTNANKDVELGIGTVYDLFRTNKLKIFSKCQNLLNEIDVYQRDEKGKIVKKYDHACDAMRYGIRTMKLIKRPINHSKLKNIHKSKDNVKYGDY